MRAAQHHEELNVTELFTLQGLILRYVNFTSENNNKLYLKKQMSHHIHHEILRQTLNCSENAWHPSGAVNSKTMWNIITETVLLKNALEIGETRLVFAVILLSLKTPHSIYKVSLSLCWKPVFVMKSSFSYSVSPQHSPVCNSFAANTRPTFIKWIIYFYFQKSFFLSCDKSSVTKKREEK